MGSWDPQNAYNDDAGDDAVDTSSDVLSRG